MPSMTNFGLLTNEQKTIWSTDLWEQARNLSFVNQFSGKGANSLIQHVTELKKSEKGARAVMTLVNDMEGDGEGELHPSQDQGVKFHGSVSTDQAERAGAAVKHI